ncbi:unnamed protein product [Spirodela intermedia]|uniref:J domain-containing protein n=1 Tax=Spirodela intermedia TaxID=51605 RepID=A0A7I8KIM8_SPIIN|nr:unnamed protein product [Spirodela intermedia]
MGGDGRSKRGSRITKKKRSRRSESDESSDDEGSSRSVSSSGSETESSDHERSSKGSQKRDKSRRLRESRREKKSTEMSSSRKRKREKEREVYKKERRERRRQKRRSKGADKKDSESVDSSSVSDDSHTKPPKPEAVLRHILKKFPDAAGDLRQLLQIIDSGQAVDVRGISDKSMVKLLKKLFFSLKLKRNEDGVFLLPPDRLPTLDVVGSLLSIKVKPSAVSHSTAASELQAASPEKESVQNKNEAGIGPLEDPRVNLDSLSHQRRFIGPAMPSAELLAAAAALTEAATAMRDADLEDDGELLIGPPPPAVVSEVESANEAERFEEVTRIVGSDPDKPYDVLGANWKMSTDNIKKKYWKLSLMVHPDKCSHPQAHQAFVILNKCFKLLQDTEKRKELDEKIKLKEEQEQFKVELRSLREAAQWRKLQGISMEGDDILLAETEAEAEQPKKRDEWMTTLPPERKPGITTQSTTFSRTNKEGRGDTSVWTDNPLDKAHKAKQSYLEAYNKVTATSAADSERMRSTADADLVDKYNQAKRAKSLVQKHREESGRSKGKAKRLPLEKEEWAGQHPWKPWDREKDLSAGRQKVNLDSKNMSEGLSSRFSSSSFQRDFL